MVYPFYRNDPQVMTRVVRQVKQPCLAFKILRAGRMCSGQETVREAFRFAFANIKPSDAVIVGMYPRFFDEIGHNTRLVGQYGACQRPSLRWERADTRPDGLRLGHVRRNPKEIAYAKPTARHLGSGFLDSVGSGGAWSPPLSGQVPAEGQPTQDLPEGHGWPDGQAWPAGHALALGQSFPAGHALE